MKCYNAYIMLQKIYISNKCCSFELFYSLKNPEKNVSWFLQKYYLFSTLIILRYIIITILLFYTIFIILLFVLYAALVSMIGFSKT